MNVNHVVLRWPAPVRYSLGCLKLVVSGLTVILREKSSCHSCSCRYGLFSPGNDIEGVQDPQLQWAAVCSWVTGVGTHRHPEDTGCRHKGKARNSFSHICLINVICPHVLMDSYCDWNWHYFKKEGKVWGLNSL